MKFKFIAVMAASLLVAGVAVSHDSLWIDEAFSAHYASAANLAIWWRFLRAGAPADLQMPLYMFFLWVWEKLFGSSEWALRAANIPWFLLAQAAFWVGFRRWPRLQIAAVICGACDPFLWRYLNEARPYAMQYSGAAIVVSCLAWLGAESAPVIGATWISAFGGGLFILCASCALGIPWTGAALLAFLCLAWRRARIVPGPRALAAGVAAVLALAGLAAYLVWVEIEYGFGGVGGFGHRFESLCFAAYELLGFAGLGPSRIAVTMEHDPRIFFPFIKPLILLAVLQAGVLVFAARAFFHGAWIRQASAAAVYLCLPLAFLTGLVFLLVWHAEGRHFTPATPFIILAMALGMATAWSEGSKWKIGWATAFAMAWLVSSLEIRFAARHRRDDYRDAAQAGLTAIAQGKRIWWAASNFGAEYYRLPVTADPGDPSRALDLWHPLPEYIAGLPQPDEVILSKPVIFDPYEGVTTYLDQHHYRLTGELPAFSIWEK